MRPTNGSNKGGLSIFDCLIACHPSKRAGLRETADQLFLPRRAAIGDEIKGYRSAVECLPAS
jgi:hypothetical protein